MICGKRQYHLKKRQNYEINGIFFWGGVNTDITQHDLKIQQISFLPKYIK